MTNPITTALLILKQTYTLTQLSHKLNISTSALKRVVNQHPVSWHCERKILLFFIDEQPSDYNVITL